MKRLLATTALCFAMAVPAMADSRTGGAMATPEQVNAAEYGAGDMTVGVPDLMGRTLYMSEQGADEGPYEEASDQWRTIGEVGDVLITPEGQISAVVVDAGAVIGSNDARRRIAIEDLSLVPDADDEGEFFAVFTGDRSLLEEARTFLNGRDVSDIDPEETGYAELSTRDTYARTEGDTLGEGEMTGDGVAAPTADEGTMTAENVNPDAGGNPDGERLNADQQVAEGERGREPQMLEPVDIADLTAEDLEGVRVFGADNDWIGDVGELVISEDGRISHAIVDVGGFLGIGEKPVAVSFDEVDVRSNGRAGGVSVYLDATEQELDAMERWDG